MERQTLSSKAAAQILVLIQQGNYAVGDKLPTEAQLVQQVGVGRNTVREALRILASRNIILIRQGSGCFLSEKKGVSEDPLGLALMCDRRKLAEDLMQIRLVIEPEIASLAAQNATDDDVQCLQCLWEELEGLARRGEDFSQNDQRFHSQLAQCTHNQVISKLLPVITEGVAVFSDEVSTTEYENTLKSHQDLVSAVRAHRSVEAKELMLFHLLYNKHRFSEDV
ncbi:MAG: FadR/GntR family transcriptional regulator [Ruthenibacterium sp.]